MNKHIFCFGFGYVASYLKDHLSHFKISSTRRPGKTLLANQYYFDENSLLDFEIFKDVTHILISIPPNENGDLVYRTYGEKFKELKSLKKIIYLSSTSVYGDHEGEYVNEDSKTNADDNLGKHRILAEMQWIDSELSVDIIRLSGIYGPNRSVIDRLRHGDVQCIHKEGHFFSRIHVKDIVKLLSLIIEDEDSNQIYNFADDYPCSQSEVTMYAYNLMGKEAPRVINFQDAKLSPAMKHYYNANKRVSNAKIKHKYNYNFIYPSYKEGLKAILDS